jgi:MFS family permease
VSAGRARGSSILPRPGSLTSGLLGLSVSGQVGFLVVLRVRELGGGFDDIGLIAGVSSLASALLAVASGRIIDRVGALRVFITATLTAVVTMLAMVTFTDHRLFLVSGPVLATASMASWTSLQMYVTGLGEGLERAVHIGRFSATSSLGELTGPLIAGAAAQLFGPRFGLLVPAAYSAAFVVFALRLRATEPVGSDGPTRSVAPPSLTGSTVLSLLRRPQLRLALALSTSRLWASSVFLTFAPVFLVESGLTEFLVGAAMSTTGLFATLIAPSSRRLAARVGELRVLRGGLAVGAVAVALVPAATSVPFLLLAPILLGVANGLTLPILLSLTRAAVPPERGGSALGLRSMVNGLTSTAAPLVVGPLLGARGGLAGFLAGGAGAGALILLAHPAARSRPSRSSTGRGSGSEPSALEEKEQRDGREDHQHAHEVEQRDHDRRHVPGVGEEGEDLDRAGGGGEHVAPRLQTDHAQDQRDQYP